MTETATSHSAFDRQPPLNPDRQGVQGVIFVLLWFGALASIVASCAVARREAASLIRDTAEYRCLQSGKEKAVRIRWDSLRNLNGPGTGYTVGTLFERAGTNCIPDDDAVSYALLPESAGPSLSLVRIAGAEIKANFRQRGEWADVTNESGQERWRNDGGGYRRINP